MWPGHTRSDADVVPCGIRRPSDRATERRVNKDIVVVVCRRPYLPVTAAATAAIGALFAAPPAILAPLPEEIAPQTAW